MDFKKFIFGLASITLLFSCSEETTLIFSETVFTTDSNKLVEVIIPQASGSDEAVVKTINTTIKNKVMGSLKIGDQVSEKSKTIEASIDQFNSEYEAFNADFPDSTQPWDAQIDGEVMYQSPEIISISLSSYTNTGGAHGNLTISFLNFNAKTGQLIKNKDLFNNINTFTTLAKQYFDDTVLDKSTLNDPESFQLPQNIGLNDEGVILLYNTYEIAPYATGIIEFDIPFDKVDSLLNFDGSQ